DFERDLDFMADLSCASDFSNLQCFMKEGFVFYGGAMRHLQNLELTWNATQCFAQFQYLHQGHLLTIGLDVGLEPKVEGRLRIKEEEASLAEGQRPLTVDWEHIEGRGIVVHSIEGVLGGVEASFHAEASLE